MNMRKGFENEIIQSREDYDALHPGKSGVKNAQLVGLSAITQTSLEALIDKLYEAREKVIEKQLKEGHIQIDERLKELDAQTKGMMKGSEPYKLISHEKRILGKHKA